MTNVELKAARLIAEVFPHARDLATKADIHDLNLGLARLETKMEALHANTLRWMVGLIFPAWIATAGALFALAVKA